MPIDITIIKSPENVRTGQASQTFSEGGGTIGRGQENTWVLDDPDRFMSSQHSEIIFHNGQYFLTDLSTNGTFFNGSSEPIGNGNRVNLNDGDRFVISDYEFLVNMRSINAGGDDLFSQPADAGPFTNSTFDQNNDFADYQPSSFAMSDPFAMSDVSMGADSHSSDLLRGVDREETDPLAFLDKVNTKNQSSYSSNVFNAASHSDQANAMNESINWPGALPETGGIPDNWDDDIESNPVHGLDEPTVNSDVLVKFEIEYRALEEENQSLMKEIARLTQQLKTQGPIETKVNSSRAFTEYDQTLIEAMGLQKWNLSKAKMTEISQVVGVLVRETLEGMMQVLSFRKKIKEEFRINVTTIQPVENNPLKFSANLDDAMENMFIKENNAYKEPVEALREGFQGVAEHQVAVLAGMQAAFRGMIERFDPGALEKRFEKYNKSGLIQLGLKGKNWESYKRFHEELVNNMDNSFQHLFGYDFVQAYEEQMQRLAMSRKSGKKKKVTL